MKIFGKVLGTASVLSAMLMLAGCGGGGGDGTVAKADDSTTTTVTTTTTTTLAVSVINYDQTGTLYPQPTAATPPDPNGWETAASRIIPGLTLIEDRSATSGVGPDAWDATAHPLVYIASQGNGPGIATDTNGDGKFQKAQGLLIFDATTHEALASREYLDTSPVGTPLTTYFEPHGLGVSADGNWIYVEGTDNRSTMTNHDVLNIINARTLKVDKIINSRVHHVKSVYDAELKKNLIVIDAWGPIFLLDPSNNNKVVKAVDQAVMAATQYSSYGDYSGKYLFVTTSTGFPGSMGGVTVFNLATNGAPSLKVAVRINTDQMRPIFVAFSANGKYAYVSDYASGSIARINISDSNPGTWKYDGRSLSGATNLYGLVLNWTNTNLFGISRISNASVGVAATAGFGSPDALSGGKVLGPVYLNGCQTPDHGIVHPDPAQNELWISCTTSPDTVVVDMGDGKTLSSVKVKATLKSPNDGTSHNGAFVKYTVSGGNWTGELLSDTNGMHGSAVATYQAAAAAAGN